MLSAFRPYRHLVRPVIPQLIGALFCSIVYAAATGLALPVAIRKALPVIFPGNKPPGDLELIPSLFGCHPVVIGKEHAVAFALTLFPLSMGVRALAQFGKDYCMDYAGLRTLESMRLEVFQKLQALHLDFFRKIPAGDISQRMSGDTAMVRYALIDVFGDLVTQPFTLIFAAGAVVLTAMETPGMAPFLFSLIAVPLTVIPIRHVGKKLQKRSRQLLDEGGAMNAMLVESIQAPREIRAYNLQDRENVRYKARTGAFLHFQMKCVKYEKALSPIIDFIATCSITFAIWQLVRANSKADSAAIIALITALYLCYGPVKTLGSLNSRLKQAGSALARLDEILNAPVEIADPASPKPLPEARGEIVFDNVGFGYPAGGRVFDNVNLRIRPGEIVALVGESGSGKSTFANLVPRFYDATAGSVAVDGVNVKDVAQAKLRDRIALVSQEPILFDDSVAANLRIGKPDASDDEIREAARKAGALAFIESLPEGFATRVGERGGLLSGGQRQRLSIARAFLKNAPILILDEATSALDSQTEAQVQASLEELARGKTVLIIAHRFSTIRFATRILVFDKNAAGIAADGTHAGLMTASPLYRSLYERQQFGE